MTAWRLNGSTSKVLECCVTQTASKAHLIVVLLGGETFLHETYPDKASTVRRAMQIREGLLKGGGWTVASELKVPKIPTAMSTMLGNGLAVADDPRTSTVRCPHCGHGAGIYRVAAEDRTPSTPIRCLSCRREAVIEEWRDTPDSGPLRP